MIAYIVKSVLCSALLIGAYQLFLEREKTHRFKRSYLIASLLLSLTIPLITIEFSQDEIINKVSSVNDYLPMDIPFMSEASESNANSIGPITDQSEGIMSSVNWTNITLIVYGLIAAALLLRLCNNFLSILSDVNDKSTKSYLGATFIFHEKYVIPYSFLNCVFIREEDFPNQQILLHELTHVRQKHSLDILLTEFIHCLMWFNPVMFLYKKSMRLNHEFLADEVVINNFPTAGYQQVLFQKVQIQNALTLTSNLNYSGTKKRFIMMTTMKNKTRASFRIALAFLVVVSAVTMFTEKVYGQNDSIPTVVPQSKIDLDSLDKVKFDSLIHQVIKFRTNKNGTKAVHFYLTGVSKEQRNEAWKVYNNLSDEQKTQYSDELKMAIKFAFTSPPPPKKNSPTAQEFASYADPTIYGVWLDGKRISNSELAKYKATDIAHVFKSRLMKNAAHYGRYKFHLDLMTHAYFDKTYSEKSNL